MYTNLSIISRVPATHFPGYSSDQEINENLKRHCSLGKYDIAAQYGDSHLAEIRNDSNLHLENQVLYAKALMYCMDVENANRKHDELLRFLLGKGFWTPERKRLLGLIVNSLGYQAYFCSKDYLLAGGLFAKALEFFDPSSDEYATSLDNLARASASCGREIEAESWVQEAFLIRSRLHNPTRIRLSQISCANVEFELGKYEEAYFLAKKAVSASSDTYPRGKALAHLIYGRVQAELARYDDMDIESAKPMLEAAQASLLCAKDIFENVVQTPLKNLEVASALACVDRYTAEVYARHKMPLPPRPQNDDVKLKRMPLRFDLNRYVWLVNFQP